MSRRARVEAGLTALLAVLMMLESRSELANAEADSAPSSATRSSRPRSSRPKVEKAARDDSSERDDGAGLADHDPMPATKRGDTDKRAKKSPSARSSVAAGKPEYPDDDDDTPVRKTDDEWKKQLTSQQYLVTRKKETEKPFTGKYARSKKHGTYRCVCCGAKLFASDTKFESGTGWPSFWAPIREASIKTAPDYSKAEERVEVRCARCDAHLGHVFDDGPRPTGLRFCINSASLKLEEKKRVAARVQE
ncbi:MAG TPA: peptide-methionine (R)-S-oxide reductase MsrB [Pirellulales bacterium]|nr:peptide-methionine (R)-S-oxide reductase MsrB [Pirellulales bacterium]